MLDSRSEQTNTLEFLGPIKNNNFEGHIMTMDSSVERSGNEEKAGNLSDHADGIQFRPSRLNNGDESGVCSPPLWSKSPPRSPPGGSKSSQNYKIRNSPPASLRVQAIARGQKELMEMVKSMPESSYELSLKDLVDHQKAGFVEDDGTGVDQEQSGFITNNKKQGSTVKKQGSVRKQASVRKQPSIKKAEKKMARTGSNMSESNSNNTGLFLKMVFPMPLGASKAKPPKGKAKTKGNPYVKVVSTKHVDDDLNDKSSKSVDQKQYWWQRRYNSVVSDDSESGGLSSNGSSGSSGSSGSNDSSISNKSTRKKGGLLRGCSPFHLNRKKNSSVSE